MTLASAVYEGGVRHRRFRPVRHAFCYGLFMMYLDLSELDRVFTGYPFWSVGWPNLAYLRRKDHLGDPALPLEAAVRDLVAERTGLRPGGPIRLLTHLRYLGHCFNPVSFYYCFDAAGERVETIVAEVNNTPWHERHCYVCDRRRDEGRPPWHRYHLRKAFHVSPFMDMDQRYDWRFHEPGPTINVHMQTFEGGAKMFDATMRLERRPITPANLARVLVRYPVMTVRVVTAIHWQALRLWRKGAPFFVHPAKRNREGAA